MPAYRTATVEEVLEEDRGIQRLRVEDGIAVLYTRYVPPAEPGDRVVLNTTATELSLGSGGEDFVVWNLAHETYRTPSEGHIMKLRYTPVQTEVLAVEAPESPHHHRMAAADDLGGMPVLAASLHSQLLPALLGLRMRRPQARVVYVMTDGGAVELALSNTVRRLRELGWLEASITVGHAVGGDFEAVNVYSGLLAARYVAGADVAIAGMGVGVVGTSTVFGTTGLEMGLTLNAAATLAGRPVAVVRMSSGDDRDRHAGLSHHARTALERVALAAVDVPVPRGHRATIGDLGGSHRLVEVDADGVLDELREAEKHGLAGSHMGRSPADDTLFFLAAGAAGIHAGSLLDER